MKLLNYLMDSEMCNLFIKTRKNGAILGNLIDKERYQSFILCSILNSSPEILRSQFSYKLIFSIVGSL